MRGAVLLLLFVLVTPAAGQSEEPALGIASADTSRMAEPMRRLRAVERRLAHEPNSLALHLERLGALYLLGVEDPSRMQEGVAVLVEARVRFDPAPGSPLDSRLLGYHGAFTVLRAKHAFWPHHKLGYVRDGLALLDRAVSLGPADATLRYLRLMSGYYLPTLFGRKATVRSDFHELARLLPTAADHFPGPMYGTVIRFVLDHGDPDAAERGVLESIAAGF